MSADIHQERTEADINMELAASRNQFSKRDAVFWGATHGAVLGTAVLLFPQYVAAVGAAQVIAEINKVVETKGRIKKLQKELASMKGRT